jgi:hypothetical protein
MIVSETEAKAKICPFALISNEAVIRKCTASECMGWRWVSWRDSTTGAYFDRKRCEDDVRVGTCGFKPPAEVKA